MTVQDYAVQLVELGTIVDFDRMDDAREAFAAADDPLCVFENLNLRHRGALTDAIVAARHAAECVPLETTTPLLYVCAHSADMLERHFPIRVDAGTIRCRMHVVSSRWNADGMFEVVFFF